jgi:hypothetical protein
MNLDRVLEFLSPEYKDHNERERLAKENGNAFGTSFVPGMSAGLLTPPLVRNLSKGPQLPMPGIPYPSHLPSIPPQNYAHAETMLQNSGIDAGFLKPRNLPSWMSSSENYAYVPSAGFLERKLLNITPEEEQSWRPHGMVTALNVDKPTMAPHLMAHELGHGMARHGEALLPKLIARLRTPAQSAGGLMALVDLLRGVSGNKSLGERENLLNTASIAAGAGAAPTLIDEFNASRNAMKLLRSLPPGVAEEYAARGAKVLPRAWGTYGLGALAAVLSPQAAKWWYQSKANQ